MSRRSRKRPLQPARPDPISPAPAPGDRLYLKLLWWLGAGLFLVSIAAGVWRSLVTRHHLPQVGVEYVTELGKLVAEQGRVASLREIRTAARIDFDSEPAVQRLIESAQEAGDNASLIWALVALTRLRPEDGAVRNQLASALLSEGRVVEALAQAEHAVRLLPDSADAYCNLGAALLGLEEKPAAAGAYREALERDPQSAVARRALEFPLRGF